MPETPSDSGASRRERPADGEPWDGGVWVDVGTDGHWRPTFEERSRSMVVFAVLLGLLLLAAAFASIDDGDGDDRVSTPSATTTTTTEATTTTTEALRASSVDGAPAPTGCEDDDRGAAAMRDRAVSTVLVLNGTPRGGHAGANTDRLDGVGYTTVQPGNATIRPGTTIEYLPGYCAEAIRLVFDLGVADATIEPIGDASGLGRAVLLVTLGNDSL